MESSRKVAIIAGAGATRSDAIALLENSGESEVWEWVLPPLNANFFKDAYRHGAYTEIPGIEAYMRENHAVKIFGDGDNLEHVMSAVYADYSDADGTDGTSKKQKAEIAFRNLLRVVVRRIANTTDGLSMHGNGHYGRIIGGYLGEGVAPENVTVITFNYDLQIEKAVNALRHGAVFNFPYCYNIPLSSRPDNKKDGTGEAQRIAFNLGRLNGGGVNILKLHGSLNWFHDIDVLTPNARQSLSGTEKPLFITHSVNVLARDIQAGKLLPAIIPPIGDKKSHLGAFGKIWGNAVWEGAGNALRESNEIVIFGYSCAEEDKASEALVQSIRQRGTPLGLLSVIDPSTDVHSRYRHLTERVDCRRENYESAGDFLKGRFAV